MVAGVIVWIIISILIVSLSIWDHKRVAKIEQKEREARETKKREEEIKKREINGLKDFLYKYDNDKKWKKKYDKYTERNDGRPIWNENEISEFRDLVASGKDDEFYFIEESRLIHMYRCGSRIVPEELLCYNHYIRVCDVI